jgi:hypothetical protein
LALRDLKGDVVDRDGARISLGQLLNFDHINRKCTPSLCRRGTALLGYGN